MTESGGVDSRYAWEFADLLQKLKDRADTSYEALARRSGVSGSALHRYCSGAGVPNNFDPIARFGRACGASAQELLELHRLWALVDAGRRRGVNRGDATATAPSPTSSPVVPTVSEPSDTLVTEARAGTETAAMPSGATSFSPPDGASGSPTRTPGSRRLQGWRVVGQYRLRRRWSVLVGILLAVGGMLAGTALVAEQRGDDDGASKGMLFSDKCRFVAMGHQDACVRELQTRLERAGLDLDIDGSFGPFTQMRVVVFQILAGLEPNGVVDDRTKRALYSGHVRARPWSADRVDRRIREVFTEDTDRASGIAKCASNMDPLFSLGNTNGTRNWGVFQLYDGTLRELDGTPRQALDPDWNILAAHRLWSRTHDFRAWPACDKAYEAGAAKASPSRTELKPSTSH